ncbi:MAG: HEAT repeat domain-containing protein [Gemmatimonadota bacterium]
MRRIDRMISAAVMASLFVACSALGLSAQELGLRTVYREAAGSYSAALDAESLYPQDPADSLYRAAREALNRDSYRSAAEMFAEVYERYPRSRYAAQSLYYQAFALYRNGRERDLREAEDALRQLQGDHADAEVARRDAAALMARIQGELARRGDAEAAENVARTARGISGAGGEAQACESEDDEMRMAALSALLQMNSEQAIPILKKVLQQRGEHNACTVEMRRKAVFLLAQHLDEENVDILLDVVRSDPDREVRMQAVFWLSQVPGERTVDALEEIVIQSDDAELQEKAIFALAQVNNERASQILRDYAMRKDAPADLRANAIFWLGQQGRSVNAEFLREIYGSTTELEVKEKIIFSLAQSKGKENAEWLLGIAGDTNEPMEIRKKAMFWAGQSGVSAVEMAALYDRMPNRELKEQIIFSLAQQGDDEAVDKLIGIARSETDIELRKKVIFWLSQSDDPRVSEFLLEIIEGGQ